MPIVFPETVSVVSAVQSLKAPSGDEPFAIVIPLDMVTLWIMAFARNALLVICITVRPPKALGMLIVLGIPVTPVTVALLPETEYVKSHVTDVKDVHPENALVPTVLPGTMVMVAIVLQSLNASIPREPTEPLIVASIVQPLKALSPMAFSSRVRVVRELHEENALVSTVLPEVIVTAVIGVDANANVPTEPTEPLIVVNDVQPVNALAPIAFPETVRVLRAVQPANV